MVDYVILYASSPWENRKIYILNKQDNKFARYKTFELSVNTFDEVTEVTIKPILKNFLDYINKEMVGKSLYISPEGILGGSNVPWIPLDTIIMESGQTPTTYKKALEIHKKLLEEWKRPKWLIRQFESAISTVKDEELPFLQYENFNENNISELIEWFLERMEES